MKETIPESLLPFDNINQAAKEYAKKMSNAPDKDTPDWIISNFRAGVNWALEQINKPKISKLYKCSLDEQQCSEECHGNPQLKEKCSFCTIEIIPESPEKGKPFLTDEDFINEFDKFRSGIFKASLDHWIETGKPSGSFLISIKNFICKYNAAASKANKRIAELGEEIERLQYWHNEKDQEADAERVSLAVAEIESDIQQATKEQERDWYNAGCMAERIIWRDKVEQFEKDRDELIKRIENSLKQPIAYIGSVDYQKGYRQSTTDILEQFKVSKPPK